MKHQGYSIEAVKEQTLDRQGDVNKPPVTVTSYRVKIGDKVVAVGLPSKEAAKVAIDTRRSLRTRSGRDPVG